MTTINDDDDSYDEIYYDKINNGRRKIWRNSNGSWDRDGDLPAVIWIDGALYYKNRGMVCSTIRNK